MADEGFHEEDEPGYTFLGSSPAEKFRELAVLHYKEARQLRERARESEAEGRTEEVRLLIDSAISRETRAAELERAAQGEGEDPSVAEVLQGQEELLTTYEAPTMSFIDPKDLPPPTLPPHMRPIPPGKIDLAWAKLMAIFKKK